MIAKDTRPDLVIPARDRPVLSDTLSNRRVGRTICIRHSLPPGLQEPRPGQRSAPPDLDEGSIIKQETERVSHAMRAKGLVAPGHEMESRTVARAVGMDLDSRVIQNGRKRVAFA